MMGLIRATSPFCVLTMRQRADRVRSRYSPGERRENKNRLFPGIRERDGKVLWEIVVCPGLFYVLTLWQRADKV